MAFVNLREKIREKVAGRQLTIASVVLLALFAVGILLLWTPPQSKAGAFNISTTDVDDAQVGVAYSFTLAHDSTLSGGGPAPVTWSEVGANLRTAGLALSAAGVISGVPNETAVSNNFTFTVTAVDGNGTVVTANKTFSMTISGTLVMNDGDTTAFTTSKLSDSGAQNVGIFQFGLRAKGEPIELIGLRFEAFGSGLDTADVVRVELYTDTNSNGIVDAGDVLIAGPQTFSQTQGFNPSVTFSNIGWNIIDSSVTNGHRGDTFLVVFDFAANVDAGKTFRLGMIAQNDIAWRGLTTTLSNLTGAYPQTVGSAQASLGVGSPNSALRSRVTVFADGTFPYTSGVTTIAGTLPIVATLFVTDNGLAQAKNTLAGAIDSEALPLHMYADTDHTLRVTQIKLTDLGSGIPAAHLLEGKLYFDVDSNGVVTANDSHIQTTTFVGDDLTFSNLNFTVRTPTGRADDSNAVNLVITYSFRSTIPILTPALTFQGRLTNAASVTAIDNTTLANAAVSFGTGAALIGHTLSVVGVTTTATGATGPRPVTATILDVDTSSSINAGDHIFVDFDTNLSIASAATAANFVLPVLGDGLGVGATVSFVGGNRMRITLGTSPTITATGTFSGATTTAGSASGINIKDTTSSIASLYALTAAPALAAIDISGTLTSSGASTSSSSSSAPAGNGGSAVCVIARHTDNQGLLGILRGLREIMLDSSLGRFFVRAYYAI